MITYNKIYEIIEQIRIDKKISVEDLCDDIVSVRTYYRYLNNTSPAKLNFTSKLLTRLQLSLANIVLYGVHFREEDNGVTRFLSRVLYESYHDIQPICERVLKLDIKDELNRLALKTFILKYEYDREIITKETYRNDILEIVEKIKAYPKTSVLVISIYLSLLEIDLHNEHTTLDEVMDYINNADFRIDGMYYFFSLDRTLNLALNNEEISLEKYEKLFEQSKRVMNEFYFRDVTMNHTLFSAYHFKLHHDISNANQQLYKYIMYAINMMGKRRILSVIERIKEVFNLDFHEFLIDETKKEMNLSYIEIID